MNTEVYHFATCDACEWSGPLRSTAVRAEQDAMDHELDHHDDDQREVDIGDDMYEQERYSEKPIDIVPDDDKWEPQGPR